MGAGAKIAVVGCGHVGTVTAASLAELGHDLIGVDVNADLVNALNRGDVPFIEPGLDELFRKHLAAGKLSFTTSYEEALAEAEFVFLCVNTPAAPVLVAGEIGRAHV